MQIDPIGDLNWFIQMPVRPEGYALLVVYLALTTLVILLSRRSFFEMRRPQWLLYGGLAVSTIVLSNVLLWRFTAPSFQPVPNLPQESGVPSIPLLAAVPVLLGALWLGIGPAVTLGALSGFIQAGFQSGPITQRFEVIAFAYLVAILLRQNYTGRISAMLRRPSVAGPMAALITWPVMFPSFFFYTPGETLAALNYAWPLFMAGLMPTLVAGLSSGVSTDLIQARLPHLLKPRAAATAAPWDRSLTRKLLWAFITFTVGLVIVLVYLVSASALSEAKRTAIAQMSRDALSAARAVPSFFQSGQGLISEFTLSDELHSPDPAVRQARLSSALRTGPYFDQLMLFDAAGVLTDAYPVEGNVEPTPDEQQLIARVLSSRAPQTTVPFSLDGQSLITFVAAIEDPTTGQVTGALLGRTRLQLNPLLVRLRDGLQNTQGTGVGYLVDENNRIVVHQKPELIMTQWSLDPTLKPIETTPEGGDAYEDRFPDGTPRLLFVQPAQGTNWLVVIELPVISVLQLALQISGPLVIALLIIGLITSFGVIILTQAVTRPITQLSRAAQRIAEGDLDRPVTISGEDEVGRLGSAFEQMRLSLKDRVDDLSLLLEVSRTVSSSLDLERGVPPLLSGAMQASPARVARLVLLNEGGEPLQVLSNEPGPQTLTPLDRALAALAVPSDSPILMDNVMRARARAMLDPNLIGPGIKAIAVFPIRRQARPTGAMWLGYTDTHKFSESEVNVLGTLAGQAAVLIENAQLFQAAEGGRRRLQAVLTSTSDAVIVTDKDNRVLLCNPATEVSFRLKPGTSTGRVVQEVWPDATMTRLLDPASATTRTEEIVLPDGRTMYGSASAIISGDGQVIGRVAVLRDITHLKELDAMKSEFVATVSHDLRAPLTYMRGYATMLPMVGSLTPKQQDYVEKVMAGIEQMTELIDDLLDLGRIEAGVGLVRESCSLADIVRTVVESMNGQALAHGLTLSITRTDERLIQGDVGLLRHAITNLVDNAVKYTPAGGSVAVAVETRDSAMIVSVKDSGIGIAPADQVRLFERFFRVKRRETIDIKGTGLGLAIVKSIAEWHGGRVWVESQLGEGATFYFLVPFSP